MKFAVESNASLHRFALTALLASLGASAMAQDASATPSTQPSPSESRMDGHDPAKMQAMMAKRGDATKALYAALTPEQQKVFDVEQKKHRGHGGPGHHGGPGSHKG